MIIFLLSSSSSGEAVGSAVGVFSISGVILTLLVEAGVGVTLGASVDSASISAVGLISGVYIVSLGFE